MRTSCGNQSLCAVALLALAVINFAPPFCPVFVIILFAAWAERDDVVFVFFISSVLVVCFRAKFAASLTTANKPVEPTPYNALF